MIKITMKRNETGICNGFLVKGHAGYDEYGKDIVCAAVSILVINTINSIEKFTEDHFTVNSDEKSGTLEFDMISDISKESSLLLKSFILGLEGIEEQYGNQYIKIC